MYPQRLLAADVKSEAERKVYKAVQTALDDDWEAFHSASLIARDPAEGATDDEIDFVLCHPEQAIVCLEVKGGGIECRHGEWRRIGPGGKREWMPDPFGQALDHRYSLQRKIAEVDGWKQKAKELFVVHALAFPDITVEQLALAPDAPPALIIDRNGVREIAASIERVIAYHRGARDKRRPPGAEGAEMLRDLLAPRITIDVPLAEKILEEEEQLIQLTVDQTRLLNAYGRNRRMLVTGCAGSGKTLLAVERAKRLAADGQDVLFVCFNRRLRDHLAEREGGSGIEFFTFHRLCATLAGKAGIKLKDHRGKPPPPEFWDEELPDALIEAIEKLGPQYDALFVDEAQDLETHWLDALLLTLRDESSAYIWLFMDANQQVYGANFEVPNGFTLFDLDVNCRNTQAIHREVIKKYKGEVVPRVIGPEGRPAELITAKDQPAAVAGVLERLCGREEIAPQDVVVLSSHGTASGNSRVASAGKLGKYTLTEERGKLGDYVHFSSIRGFKGLESPVVILCELEDLDDESLDQQLYVGVSRAKNHCVVVVPA